MRFLLLMTEPDHFDRWDASDDELKERVFADFRAFGAAVSACGELVAGEALDRPSTARTVRPAASADRRAVTEGPFAETVEQLGGFYLVDVPDETTALEVAALLPREFSIEVRFCPDVGATPR